jgi:sterol desaturase/sphingolipid hydroxylase (fatty acid hydroxylase superfamily)
MDVSELKEKGIPMLNQLLSLISFYQFNWSLPSLSPCTGAVLILLVSFAGFAAMEKHAPRSRVPTQCLRQSYNANLSLFMFNSVVMSLLSASMLWIVARQHFSQGLLSYIPNSGWKVALSLLSLDLLLYAWHKACHRYDGLWMFHKVHHNDPYLNVSTGFRVHITELFMSYILKATVIILMGIDELTVLVNEVVTTLFIMFHHTNSTFKGERWLGYIFTTPSLHRTHHSVERKEHDSNYGAILSIWDRLFGTLLEFEPKKIGVNGYSPLDFISLVKFGFVKKLPPVPLPANLDVMIAEAAYYKAEKRNFKPGQEWDDWLAAQQEILRSVYGNRKNPLNLFISIQSNAVNWFNKLNCSLGIREERCQKYS